MGTVVPDTGSHVSTMFCSDVGFIGRSSLRMKITTDLTPQTMKNLNILCEKQTFSFEILLEGLFI